MSFVVAKDPRCEVKSEADSLHVVHEGAQRVSYQTLTFDSFQLNAPPVSNIITINPPSNQTIVDRLLKVRYYLEVKVSGGDLEIGSNDCLRQLPANSLIDVTSLKINGETVSDNTGDILHARLCYGNEADDRRKTWSTSAAQPDQYQQLDDYLALGTNRNVAAEYGENAMEPTRASVSYEVVDAQTVRFEIVEPIFISPMFDGCGRQREGLVNVNEIHLNLRFKSDTQRILTCAPRLAPGVNITSVSCVQYRAPEVLVCYLTPDNLQPIPAVQTLGYSKPRQYLRQIATPYTPGEVRREFTDSVRLSQIPRYMMLFARRSEATSTFDKPDSFLKIKSVRINWNNESSLLSGASTQDLYEISRRNGCNLSWPQWSKHRGSVFMCEYGKDIGLSSGLAPGCQGSYTVQCDVEFENVSSDDYTATFYMVLFNIGSFSIAQNSARSSLGNLSPSMVLAASQGHHVPAHHMDMAKGKSFMDSLESIIPMSHAPMAPQMMAPPMPQAPAPAEESRATRRTVGGSLLRRR